MTRTLSRAQVRVVLDEMLEIIEQIRTADDELRVLAYDPDRNWPPGTGLGGGGGGGPSIPVEIRPGDEGYDPSPGASNVDRIAATSVEIAALRPDPVQDARRLLWSKLATARNALTEGWNAAERATRDLRHEPPPPPPEVEVWCTNCESFGLNQPRGNPKEIGKDSTLCGFCARYQSAHGGQLPPRRLCELHAEGKRLTAPLVASIEAAAARERRAAATSKKKRRRSK